VSGLYFLWDPTVGKVRWCCGPCMASTPPGGFCVHAPHNYEFATRVGESISYRPDLISRLHREGNFTTEPRKAQRASVIALAFGVRSMVTRFDGEHLDHIQLIRCRDFTHISHSFCEKGRRDIGCQLHCSCNHPFCTTTTLGGDLLHVIVPPYAHTVCQHGNYRQKE
jgi:hypothetical protein